MTANRNFLRKKYARVIEEYARMAGCPLDEAMDAFYRSQTYRLMRDGVSDMHCMSENYLAEELADELAAKKGRDASVQSFIAV